MCRRNRPEPATKSAQQGVAPEGGQRFLILVRLALPVPGGTLDGFAGANGKLGGIAKAAMRASFPRVRHSPRPLRE